MDLGCSVCSLGGVGAAHYFHSKNLDPDPSRHCIDNVCTTDISWPNYHSGSNGDYQEITPVEPLHPVLRDPDDLGGIVRFLPAHPHEGAVGKPANDDSAKVVADQSQQSQRHSFQHCGGFRTDRRGRSRHRAIHLPPFCRLQMEPADGSIQVVSERPGGALAKSVKARRSVARYVGNLALWLAGRNPEDLDAAKVHLDRASDKALEESFLAGDPPSITRDP
jgi:hypothetical protein